MEWITKFDWVKVNFIQTKKEEKGKTIEKINQIIPKFDKHIFVPGSFFG